MYPTTAGRLREAIQSNESYNEGDWLKLHFNGLWDEDLDSSLANIRIIQFLSGIASVAAEMYKPCVCFLATWPTGGTRVVRAQRHSDSEASCWKIDEISPEDALKWILPPISPLEGFLADGYGWDILGRLADPDLRPMDSDLWERYVSFETEIKLLLNLRKSETIKSTRAEVLGLRAMLDMMKAPTITY
jgi:hypothetical protein